MLRIKPHKTIGVHYLERWYLVPRNRWLNVYLHRFSGSDDDRALHDHPWWSVSFLLKGQLAEVFYHKTKTPTAELVTRYWRCYRAIPRFLPVFRRATHTHRLVLVKGPAWTLFITGPRVREWYFHCPQGLIHYSKMTTPDGKAIGSCDEH